MQTPGLARISNGKIIALDNCQPFLDILNKNAKKEGLEKSITIKNQSMLEMNFKNASFYVIWSEGVLYFMGFQNGLIRCYQLLKNKGYLVITEALLLLSNIPNVLKKSWTQEYPDIKDTKRNLKTMIFL